MMMGLGHERIRMTVVITILGALMGMAGGKLVFRALTLHLAMMELDDHAWRYMLRAEESSSASEEFLNTMAAANLAPCSDAEIALMHHLLFESEYLKDGGRMQDGKVECDALFLRSDLTLRVFTPNFRLRDGTEVFTDLRMVPGDPEARVGVERNGFFVSFSHWRPDRIGILPLKVTLTEVDNTTRQPGWLHGDKPEAPFAVLSRDGWASAGDSLYATHCSLHYFNCFTAYVDMNAVLAAHTRESAVSVGLGGAAGGVLGFLGVLIYLRNHSMVYQLRRAIRGKKLRMTYQPIVHLADRKIVEAEALVRWTDDDGFEVSPEIFVPVAEGSGLMSELTELVVRLVLRDMGEFLRGHPDFSVNINVTATDLANPEFPPMLERSLDAAHLSASSLTIEVTESSTAKKESVVEAIHQLRQRGHDIHIDDFGTGYSSLSYLHSLAVDAIKIDKSFTHAIGTEAVTVSILPQILEMAKKLNLDIIAEGIETEEQAAYFAVQEQRILGQGYLFGRPGTPEQLEELVNKQNLSDPVGHRTGF